MKRLSFLLPFSLLLVSANAQDLLEPLIVTATGSGEVVENLPQTIRRYEAEEILQSAPRNLTDFFRTQALGELQDFGPAHANFFLRGASTIGQGQGWSDGSEVAILVNGRPSGTANLGKISLTDLANIEILKGPNSVLYGSSAMGGVINLATKDGRTFQQTELTSLYSSFNRFSETLETGGKEGAFDYYLQLGGTVADDYRVGKGGFGEQPNTDYKQASATISLGYDISDLHRIAFLFRNDGIYNAGRPGPTYSLTDYDNRYSNSAEITYTGRTQDERFRWTNKAYYVRDTDELVWSQNPLIGLIPALVAPGLIGLPGITSDVNERVLQEWGNRFSLEIDATETNTLTLGSDLRYSELDSSRSRTAAPGYQGALIGLPVVLAPLSVDDRTVTTGFFLQDSQRFLDDKLNIRAGVRYDRIDQTALPTQNSAVVKSERDEDVIVWQAGATYNPLDWLTLRGNVGTGFLSANPTQLFGDVRQVNGFAFLANPDLEDEKSFGFDLGARVKTESLTLDLAYYENTIDDYITAALIPGTANLRWRNADEKTVRGIELAAAYDLAPDLDMDGFSLEPYFSGNYFLEKKASDINGAPGDQYYLNDYQLVAGLRGGKPGKWSANLYASIAGPSAINAGFLQNANVAPADLTRTFSQPSHTVFNFAVDYQINEQFTVFGGINNILDRNYNDYFLPLNNNSTADVAPYLLPGIVSGEGISSPGRGYFVGLRCMF